MAKKRFSIMADGIFTPCNGMWLWNRDSEFTKWQHSAVWQIALG